MNFPNNQGSSGQANPFSYSSQPVSVAQSSADVRLEFLRKTYSLFLAGILASIVAGAVCLNVPAVFNLAAMILNSGILAFLLIIGLSMGAQAVSRTEGLNYVALFAFTSFMGFLIAPILQMYGGPLVTQAGFLSAVTFGSLTAYVFITKKDFTFMGGMLFVLMATIVVGGLANVLFFKSAGLSYWMAWATLLMSSGFVLYKTSLIMTMYDSRDYVAAALSLYISFFNMFMSILRILGGGRRS